MNQVQHETACHSAQQQGMLEWCLVASRSPSDFKVTGSHVTQAGRQHALTWQHHVTRHVQHPAVLGMSSSVQIKRC